MKNRLIFCVLMGLGLCAQAADWKDCHEAQMSLKDRGTNIGTEKEPIYDMGFECFERDKHVVIQYNYKVDLPEGRVLDQKVLKDHITKEACTDKDNPVVAWGWWARHLWYDEDGVILADFTISPPLCVAWKKLN